MIGAAGTDCWTLREYRHVAGRQRGPWYGDIVSWLVAAVSLSSISMVVRRPSIKKRGKQVDSWRCLQSVCDMRAVSTDKHRP